METYCKISKEWVEKCMLVLHHSKYPRETNQSHNFGPWLSGSLLDQRKKPGGMSLQGKTTLSHPNQKADRMKRQSRGSKYPLPRPTSATCCLLLELSNIFKLWIHQRVGPWGKLILIIQSCPKACKLSSKPLIRSSQGTVQSQRITKHRKINKRTQR